MCENKYIILCILQAALFALSQDGISTSRVTYQHFLHVLESFKPSLTAAQIMQYS